jgi:hypothetical protein
MWTDRLHSQYGTGDDDGRPTQTQDYHDGSWSAQVKDNKVYFEKVDEVQECPGGVCEVPWLKKKPELQPDMVNHPTHYTDGGIECIEAIEAQLTEEEYQGYLRGNCVKYLWRSKLKGDFKENLLKCQWYLERLIETAE